MSSDDKARRGPIDPKTGILPISEWGPECGRGFVRDERFGKGALVIKGTNRNKSRAYRKIDAIKNAARQGFKE